MMSFCKPFPAKSILTGFILLFFAASTYGQGAAEGKALFAQNCQTCHSLDKNGTGPALRGFKERGPWADQANVRAWVHNPTGYSEKDPSGYTKDLIKQFGVIMQSFPALDDAQIDAITEFIVSAPPPAPAGGQTPGPGGEPKDSGNSALTFGIISLALALVALILLQINSNLKKLSDDKEGIIRPDPVPFYRNKIYIALVALFLFVVVGYIAAKNSVSFGRQQGYQPDQPIYFSHKVHAGINQINCLYCHGSAWESRHAGIPTLNICMNCHKAVTTYEKGPKLHDEDGNEINGTAEIEKLFKYAGYTPGPGAQWDPAKAKPIEWVKIHNLPDHVYFNHAQHINAGNVACQSCHGNIQEMDKVSQQAELSMGWCINCHRETKVNFFNTKDSSGNKFYSIYEKFHNDMKSGKMDSVTVKDIGGLECQKCHY
jgi:mono/diheme cytochrome c family protein